MLLVALDTAYSIDDMNVPGFRLHSLKGSERRRWSVWVNGNWMAASTACPEATEQPERTASLLSKLPFVGRLMAQQAIFDALPSELAGPASAAEFEAEHRVYRPGEEEGFDVVPEGDGRFRVAGRGIELLVARHDLENEEALDYLEGRLREIGVIAALQRAGFEAGDEVVVGDLEFELDPG